MMIVNQNFLKEWIGKQIFIVLKGSYRHFASGKKFKGIIIATLISYDDRLIKINLEDGEIDEPITIPITKIRAVNKAF